MIRMVFRRSFFVALFCLASYTSCPAQDITARLAPLSPVERVRYMSGYIEANNLVNTPAFDSLLHQYKLFAERHNDILLLSQIEYLTNGKPIFEEQDPYVKIELIKQFQKKYQKKNDLLHVGDCFVAMAQIQFADEQYALAFENLLAAETIFKKLGYENIPAIGKYLHDFALDYFFFQDYEKVIRYMKQSIGLPKYNDNLDIQRYNTLGVSYMKINQLDSAYLCLNIAYQKAGEYKDSLWMGLSAGNIGNVLYLKGEYQKALGYYLEDYQINIDSDFPDIQQNASVNLAKNYLKLGDVEKARHYLLLTRKFFQKPKIQTFGNQQQLELAKLNYYDVGHQYYLKKRDYETALLYADSLHGAEKIRDRKYNNLQVEMASGQLALLESKMTLQKKELTHEKERRIKNVIIFSLIVIFLMGVALAVFIFRNRQKLNRQKQMLLSSQLEIAEHNLQLSEAKLTDFTRNIQEKTRLMEEMRKQQARYPENGNHLIAQLQQSTILTEDDWKHFRILFEQVHSGFLNRLKEKYPTISPAEIRFLTLAKLHFSTKEMAAALGVSTQSIRTNWYRVRKKINLPEEITAEELVAEI